MTAPHERNIAPLWGPMGNKPTRFAAFNDAELSELLISLDHRLAEADAGNAYVWKTEVGVLLFEVELETSRRELANRTRTTTENPDT